MEIERLPGPPHGLPSPMFADVLERILPIRGDALDLGTGTGRVALALAPRARHVVGIDLDASMVDAARFAARREGTTNVTFAVRDAEAGDWSDLNGDQGFELITSRLFLSENVLRLVPRALASGGHFLTLALEASHWHEAGGSRFNLPVQRIVDLLEAGGLDLQRAAVETRSTPVADAAAAKALLQERRLWTRWKNDGRWDVWRRTMRPSGSLTEAHAVVWARRPTTGFK